MSCGHLGDGASTHLVSSGQTVDLHLGTGNAVAEVVKRSARVGVKIVTEIRSPEETSGGSIDAGSGLIWTLTWPLSSQSKRGSLVMAVCAEVDSVEVGGFHLKHQNDMFEGVLLPPP